MKLILSKSQKKAGMMGGKISYSLDIRGDFTDNEKANLQKYKMTDEVIYSNADQSAQSTLGMLKQIATSTVIRVSDLTGGRVIECKDFMEILAVENEVKTACKNLKNLLEAMTNFDGEETIAFE